MKGSRMVGRYGMAALQCVCQSLETPGPTSNLRRARAHALTTYMQQCGYSTATARSHAARHSERHHRTCSCECAHATVLSYLPGVPAHVPHGAGVALRGLAPWPCGATAQRTRAQHSFRATEAWPTSRPCSVHAGICLASGPSHLHLSLQLTRGSLGHKADTAHTPRITGAKVCTASQSHCRKLCKLYYQSLQMQSACVSCTASIQAAPSSR